MTVFYTPLMALFITGLYGRRWSRSLIVLPTCAVLMLLLGLSIAAMGQVHLTTGWVPMLLETLVLIVSLNLVYVAVFWLLTRKWFAETADNPAYQTNL